MAGFSRGEKHQGLIDTGEALALHLSGLLGLEPPDRPPVEVYINGRRHVLTGYEVNTPLSQDAGQDMLTLVCTLQVPSVNPGRTDRVILEFSATDELLSEDCITRDECE